ncbi:MAG: N,N-dimethylformamidase beta subunit family domain-containing protein [Paenisporosarcina sp.]
MSIITDENALPGAINSDNYSIPGAGDPSIQGFTRQTSYNAGTTVQFSVTGNCDILEIYRIGHYAGKQWRLVASVANTITTQPVPTIVANSNGQKTCSAWSITASWNVPSNHVSGFHVAVARNVARNNASWIPFTIRNDSRQADIVVCMSTSTWGGAYKHYNAQGDIFNGKNVYGSGITGVGDILTRSFCVTLDRPIITRQTIVNHWDNYESAVIDFLEENGYDVKYVTSEDLHFRPSSWNNSKIYISCGHDEYWSQGMRDNVENFRDSGGHCLFMSANEVFWRTRYSADGRTIWCYKDTMPFAGHTAGTPFDPVTWTGTWRDTRWINKDPESNLTGTFFRMNGIQFKSPVISSSTYGTIPFWRNTTLVTSDITLNGSVGFEADEIKIPDGRPAKVLAAAFLNINGSYADDNGENYSGNGSLNPWGIVMHRLTAQAGVVVGFGTMAWAWLLSDKHRDGQAIKKLECQQAMVNLFKDLGASAASLRTSNLIDPSPVSLLDYDMPIAPEIPTSNVFAFDGTPFNPQIMVGGTLVPLTVPFTTSG